MDYGKIIDFFKQPQLVFVVAVTTGLIVFLPEAAARRMGFAPGREPYLPFISVLFIAASVQFATQMAMKGLAWNKGRRRKEAALREQAKLLQTLTAEERAILRNYVDGKTMTQRLNVDSGVVNGLVAKGVIYRATNRATSGFADRTYYGVVYGCDHNMQSWAWEYLNGHPELLAAGAGPASSPAGEEAQV